MAETGPSKSAKTVVKNTTKNRVAKPKKAGSVKRVSSKKTTTRCRTPNPTGKNQTTYKSARDAMHIYCENHPEEVVKCVLAIMGGASKGNPQMARLWVDLFGGIDKQQLELSGGGEISGLKISFSKCDGEKNGS